MPTVDLIYDRDCPNVRETRAELLRAFHQAGLTPRWQEWERSAPESPAFARQYGSPTILVDGADVAPMEKLEGTGCCRLYSAPSGTRGAPPAEQIVQRLAQSFRAKHRPVAWRTNLAVLPGFVVSLLPNLTCPACWPAYAGLVGSLGLGFLSEGKYLRPTTAVLLVLALAALARRAKSRGGLWPVVLGMVAAASIVVGKFYLDSDALWWTGAALLLGASVWNSWPQHKACPACRVSEEQQ